uniref:Uncharacterized protein n=1 Tax=Octopus bimaculoides TaxID=37653 RepID=A0A0L8GDU8_OCTBM
MTITIITETTTTTTTTLSMGVMSHLKRKKSCLDLVDSQQLDNLSLSQLWTVNSENHKTKNTIHLIIFVDFS